MAKGLRASVKKNNRTKLRSRVFAPVEDARTARLSAKLLELAQQSKPAKTEMDLEPEKATGNQQSSVEEPEQQEVEEEEEEMDVDDAPPLSAAAAAKTSSASTRSKKPGRVQKRHRRARNEIQFRKKTFAKTKGGPGKSNR